VRRKEKRDKKGLKAFCFVRSKVMSLFSLISTIQIFATCHASVKF